MDLGLTNLIEAALAEDVGDGDITTKATVSAGRRCKARLVAKQAGVLSGMDAFRLAFECCGADVEAYFAEKDGVQVKAGDVAAVFEGNAAAVLRAERTAMNFVQHLSGIATLTQEFVARLEGLNCRICDTRKTTPLLRRLEKAAVRHGGGANHRSGLYDGLLIKENHIVAAGGIDTAVRKAKAACSHLMRVEVEVTNAEELTQALEAGADVVLLDNMDNEAMRAAVEQCRAAGVLTEASGNVSLDRVRDMAATGVDFISVGALTHSAPVLDLSLLIEHV